MKDETLCELNDVTKLNICYYLAIFLAKRWRICMHLYSYTSWLQHHPIKM